MSDSNSTPEERAKEVFERRAAVSVGVLAAVLAFVSLQGSDATSDGLLAASRAANSWAYFQAKSIKGHTFALDGELASLLQGQSVDETRRAAFTEKCTRESARLDKEKEKVKQEAEAFEKAVLEAGHRGDRCGVGSLFLQIAIVVASIAILVKNRPIWYVSLLVGIAGIVTAATVIVPHP